MPYRRIPPFPANYAFGRHLRPAEGWPTRRMWITRFEDDHTRLRTHPVWQLATRLTRRFREMAEDPAMRFEAWDMADARDAPPIALYYAFGRPEPETMLVARDPDVMKRGVDHIVMLMGDAVFLHGRETQAFSWTVDILERRDPRTFRPLPPEPQGEIPDEDDDALSALGV